MKKIDYNYVIENIEDVIELINGKYEEDETSVFKSYYRGQSNAEWLLTPKIARQNSTLEPSISTDEDIFTILAQKQHYGENTRLLDFTRDVKVALYFACSEKNNIEKDAKIFVYKYDNITENSKYTKIACEFSQLTQATNVDNFSALISNKYDIALDDVKGIIFSILDCGFMVTPTNAFYEKMFGFNDRIREQKGCFYIPANQSNFTEIKRLPRLLSDSYKHVIIQPKCISPIIYDISNNPTILIPYRLKSQILKLLLKDYNISAKTLGLES